MINQGQYENLKCQISGKKDQLFFRLQVWTPGLFVKKWQQLQLNLNFQKIGDEPLSRDTEFETYFPN